MISDLEGDASEAVYALPNAISTPRAIAIAETFAGLFKTRTFLLFRNRKIADLTSISLSRQAERSIRVGCDAEASANSIVAATRPANRWIPAACRVAIDSHSQTRDTLLLLEDCVEDTGQAQAPFQ
jgi:hypothetical protein